MRDDDEDSGNEKLTAAPENDTEDALRDMAVKSLAVKACEEQPEPLKQIYDFVRKWRPEIPDHSIRARIYEAMKDGKIARVTEGVYFARSGPAQLLVVEGDAWEVLRKFDDDSIDLLAIDPPGKFGREWSGMGTTRPHVELAKVTGQGRTYAQPELDEAYLREAYRVLNKHRQWNTLSKGRRATGDYPRGGAACIIRVPSENRTTRPHIQKLISLAESLGFVFYGTIPIVMDTIGMGYDSGRDRGASWIMMCAGERNGVLWNLGVPNVVDARRVRNPAKLGYREHEAEKDPVEMTQMLEALTRAGDVVLDTFAGVAKWTERALAMGRHVILCDVDLQWVERIAGRFSNSLAALSGQ